MKYYIRIGTEYCWKIIKGNYYVCDASQKEFASLSSAKLKRYKERLNSMKLRYVVEMEEEI